VELISVNTCFETMRRIRQSRCKQSQPTTHQQPNSSCYMRMLIYRSESARTGVKWKQLTQLNSRPYLNYCDDD
jgi:hypothetical protein